MKRLLLVGILVVSLTGCASKIGQVVSTPPATTAETEIKPDVVDLTNVNTDGIDFDLDLLTDDQKL
ncbi:hypothetical protein AGMMS49975_23890 [Clostridia bacterium]|nr:hypothetical protein AGMMS49975_23890 [Clostridia bacterium]